MSERRTQQKVSRDWQQGGCRIHIFTLSQPYHCCTREITGKWHQVYTRTLHISPLVSSEARRNLILVTKILQNLANGVEFTDKEECITCYRTSLTVHDMKRTNAFIRSRLTDVDTFLSTISVPQRCICSPPMCLDLTIASGYLTTTVLHMNT